MQIGNYLQKLVLSTTESSLKYSQNILSLQGNGIVIQCDTNAIQLKTGDQQIEIDGQIQMNDLCQYNSLVAISLPNQLTSKTYVDTLVQSHLKEQMLLQTTTIPRLSAGGASWTVKHHSNINNSLNPKVQYINGYLVFASGSYNCQLLMQTASSQSVSILIKDETNNVPIMSNQLGVQDPLFSTLTSTLSHKQESLNINIIVDSSLTLSVFSYNESLDTELGIFQLNVNEQ